LIFRLPSLPLTRRYDDYATRYAAAMIDATPLLFIFAIIFAAAMPDAIDTLMSAPCR